MTPSRACLPLLLFCVSPVFAQAPLRGFPQEEWKPQHELEKEKGARHHSTAGTDPHLHGAHGVPASRRGLAWSKAVADYTAAQLRDSGTTCASKDSMRCCSYP